MKASIFVYDGKLLDNIVMKSVEHDQENSYLGVSQTQRQQMSSQTASRREAEQSLLRETVRLQFAVLECPNLVLVFLRVSVQGGQVEI